MSLPGQSRPAHSVVAGWARLPALGDLTELMGLIFLLCIVPLYFLDLLLFHPLVSLSPHFFKVIGLCIARFPSQPRWFFHDLSSPLVANEDKLGPKRKFLRAHGFRRRSLPRRWAWVWQPFIVLKSVVEAARQRNTRNPIRRQSSRHCG